MNRPVLFTIILSVAMGVWAFAQAPAPMQAEAPASIIAATIADMPLGTQVTINPESIIIDENKKVWLYKSHPVGGETSIVVHYMKDGTYEIEIKDEKLRWLKTPVTDELKKFLVPVKAVHLAKK